MIDIKLTDLEGLLGLKLKENQCLTYVAKSLLDTGENFGSTMLAVDVKIVDKENPSDAIERHYVAKMCPPSAFLQDMFNTPVTYKKELGLYTDIVPLLQQFQREHGVAEVMDFFPKLEGSRISLDPQSDRVDNDAVMLLPNLRYDGYRSGDRFKGFDLDCAELLMKDLAVLHAVSVAFKLQKPEEFKEKIYPYLEWRYVFTFKEEVGKGLLDYILATAEKDDESRQYLENIKAGYALGKENYANRPPAREPFATIIHNDYWVNNTLIKFENGKPVKNAMVDFQVIEYGSPAEDVIFFLYSSVTPKVLDENYDKLIDLYYDTFIGTLKQLKCDTRSFTFELLREELAASARNLQFYHLLVMIIPIFTRRGAVKELKDLGEDDIQTDQTADEFPERVYSIIRDFGKRGWI